MTADHGGFPNLNLALRQAVHLEFSCILAWDDTVSSQFNDALDENGHALAVRKYSSSKVRHIVTEHLRRRFDPSSLVVTVSYDAGEQVPRSTVPKQLRGQLRLIDRFAPVSQPLEVHGHVDFRFASSDEARDRLWFPLPTRLSPPGREDITPFDEIRGIRGVRTQKGSEEPEFTFVLDRPTNKDVSLAVIFPLLDRVGRDTPRQVLALGTAIASQLGLGSRRDRGQL